MPALMYGKFSFGASPVVHIPASVSGIPLVLLRRVTQTTARFARLVC